MSEKLSLVFWLVRKTVIFVFTGALLSSEGPVLAFLVIRVIPEASTVCGYRIMAITSAFQADDVGSIPATRSPVKLMSHSFIISTGEFSWRTDLAGGFVVLHSVDLTAYSFSAFFCSHPCMLQGWGDTRMRRCLFPGLRFASLHSRLTAHSYNIYTSKLCFIITLR